MGIQKLYKKLYEAVGGKENIELLLQKAESCTVVVKDASLIAPEKVQTLPEVKAVELYRDRIKVLLQNNDLEDYSAAKINYQELAANVIELVGGKENITYAANCMTRLRFEVKEKNAVRLDELRKLTGTSGAQWAGDQLQVIVGQHVVEVYEEVCRIAGIQKEAAIKENLDAVSEKKKFSWKDIPSAILSGLSGCMTPVLPVLIAASMIKAIVSVIGPSVFGWISETSDLYVLLTFVGDAGFYFMPVLFGYTAAKKFDVTPVLGIFLGAIMIHPTLIGLAAEGAKFSVYGIPCTPISYVSTMLPIVLSVWIMSYVEKFLKKLLPAAIKTVMAPTLTILVMLPVALCVFGPLGNLVGTGISALLMGFANLGPVFAILTTGLAACLWNFMVISGTHLVLYYSFLALYMTTGYDCIVGPGFTAAQLAVIGMVIGAFLRCRDKNERNTIFSYLISQVIGGVTEPALYGVGMKYRQPLIGLMVGGFVGGIYYALSGAGIYTLAATANFMIFAGFAGGPAGNFVHGVIGGVISCVVSAAVTYALGLSKDDKLFSKKKAVKE